MQADKIKEIVKGEYRQAALQVRSGGRGCCGTTMQENKLDAIYAGFQNISLQPIRVYRAEYAREFLSGAGLDVERLASEADGKFNERLHPCSKTSLCVINE